MTRRTKVRTAHVTTAAVALFAANSWTAYAEAQGHHTASGTWNGPVVVGWLLVVLSGLYVVALGCFGLYRLVLALWGAEHETTRSGRTAPGHGSRRPSLTPEQWAAVDAAYRNVRIVDAAVRAGRLGAEDDTQLMLLADIAELDDEFSLIDAIEAYGIARDAVPSPAVAHVPPSEREYPEPPVATAWTVEPGSLRGQGAVLHAWFGRDVCEERAA